MEFCISVDPWFLSSNSTSSKMISLAREINNSMPNFVIKKAREMIKDIDEPVITIFGVAYKGNVDDTRETPAKKIIKLAENEGFEVRCYDPHVNNFEYELYSMEEAVKNSDCIIIVTDHECFKNIEPEEICMHMRNANVLDTRNIIDEKEWKEKGFNIFVIGRRD